MIKDKIPQLSNCTGEARLAPLSNFTNFTNFSNFSNFTNFTNFQTICNHEDYATTTP